MTRISPFSHIVLKKALPALLVILMIFISLMLLVSYTDAFFLVILLWIAMPVALVQAYRKLKGFMSRKE